MKKNLGLTAALVTAIALPTAGPALAQTLSVEEIVVTARKRDENLFEIPISVTALTDAMLEQAGIDNAQDMSLMVPGLDFRQFDFGGRANPNIRVRGMIQQIITPSTQIGALFWDGSYIGGGGSYIPLGDLERVEIIKGPQTAYFGRNTFAGAINYIPKTAGDEWEGDVSFSWSPTDHDEFNINAGVGGPIGSRMGIRIWGGYDKDGGDFSFDDGEPFAQFRDTNLSGTLTYDATEDLRFKVTGYYSRATDTTTGVAIKATVPAGGCGILYRGETVNVVNGEQTPFETDLTTLTIDNFCGELPDGTNMEFPISRYPTVSQLFPPIPFTLTNLTTLNPRVDRKNIIRTPTGGLGGWHQSYRLQFSGEYDFEGHTVTVKASRANTGTSTRVDFFFGVPFLGFVHPDTVFGIGNDSAIREFYYEARIASPQDQSFRYLLGVSDYNQHYIRAVDPRRSEIDRQRSTTFAVFGSVDFDFNDSLTLSAEGRYSDESFTAIEFGDPTLPCGVITICNAENKFDAFLPRVILSYRPFDGATTYVSWSKSKLLGLATQARFINSIAPEVIPAAAIDVFGDFTPPQRNIQYEIGWKQQTDRWAFTLAAFYIDWKNQPFPAVIFTPNGGTSSFRGPGDSEYTGVDFEFSSQITDWFQLTGQASYSNGVMKDYSNFGSSERIGLAAPGVVASDGNPVRNHPEWTGSISPVFTGMMGDRGWFVRADYLYTGRHYVDYSRFNQNAARKQVNVRAGIDLYEGTTLELFGTNIFNDKTLPTTAGTTTAAGARKVFTGVYQASEVGIRLNAEF